MAAGCTKPVLYYTFENGSGTVVTDRSNAGNNLNAGAFTGDWDSTDYKRGIFSANFAACEAAGNGAAPADSDSIGDLTTFNFMHQGGTWTVSMWLRMTTSAYQGICGNTGSTQRGRMIMYNSGIRVFGASGDTTFAGSTLTLNTWTHVLVTCFGDGAGNLKLYLDGVQTGGDQTGGSVTAGDQINTWAVGNFGYGGTGLWCGQSWQGQIDEYSVWNVAFDPADVAVIYGAGTPPDVSNGLEACPPPPTEVKTISGIAADSIKTIAGISVTNIKEIGGTTRPPAWVPPAPWAETYSIDFGGGAIASADQLELPNNTDFDFEYTDPFSLSVWFKTTTTGWQGMLEKSVPFTSWTAIKGWTIAWYAGRPQFWINNKYQTNGLQAYPTSGLWSDGAWHNVVVSSAGTGGSLTLSDIAIWVDGVSQTIAGWYGPQSVSATIVNAGDIRVGSVFGGYGSGWNGGLDEISVWNTELSPTNVADIYNSGVPTNLGDHSAAANLVSWWRMGDGCTNPSSVGGCGDCAAPSCTLDSSDSSDSGARIYDMSANSHNTTPLNMIAGNIVTDVPS